MHVDGLRKFPGRLRVSPVVGSRKEPANLKIMRETPLELVQTLHVTVRPVYEPDTMVEVDVRADKYTAVIQEPRYLREHPGLKVPHIFKNALGHDDVEALIGKRNRRLKKVGFNQVRRRAMYGYINTVILDVRLDERPQGRATATNIEQRAAPAPGDPVYNSRRLLEAIVGPAVL
jgi:hypothetical protein